MCGPMIAPDVFEKKKFLRVRKSGSILREKNEMRREGNPRNEDMD